MSRRWQNVRLFRLISLKASQELFSVVIINKKIILKIASSAASSSSSLAAFASVQPQPL